MKKITLFFAALVVVVLNVKAQDPVLNNPVVEGKMVFVWDCAAGQFAASPNVEFDQTITFAVDITGTPLADWVKEPSVTAGATRSIAIDFWTETGGGTGGGGGGGALAIRLTPIKENIYGADLNFYQNFGARIAASVEKATDMGAVSGIYGNVLGFAYGSGDGDEWWQLPMILAVNIVTDPYTGEKTGPDFWNDDFTPMMLDGKYGLSVFQGYAYPCLAPKTTGIESITVDSEIIEHEYYNLQGIRVSAQPQSGLFIDKAIKANGASVVTKVLKTDK
jgi:hypothetical protein